MKKNSLKYNLVGIIRTIAHDEMYSVGLISRRCKLTEKQVEAVISGKTNNIEWYNQVLEAMQCETNVQCAIGYEQVEGFNPDEPIIEPMEGTNFKMEGMPLFYEE